jgi:DNA-binding response OmpR family regulator
VTTASPHPGSEHLLVLPERDVAERIAEDLRDEGFERVRVVREAAATEDDSESHEWAVYVLDARLPDASGGGAYEGLRERFTALAAEHDGWYDEPGDPRPPAP